MTEMTLDEKIAGYTRNIEQYRLANRHLKYGNDAGLRAMGYSEEQIANLKADGKGYPPSLIRRYQQRARELKAMKRKNKGGRNG